MSTVSPLEPSARIDTGELIKLLIAQRDLYEQLGRLAQRQRSLITGNDPEQLLGVLSDRQRILDQVNALTDRLRPYQQAWPTFRERMRPDEGEQVDQLVSQMQTLLSTILEKDKADTQLLAARKESVAESRKVLKRGRQAGQAYAASGAAGVTGTDWADA